MFGKSLKGRLFESLLSKEAVGIQRLSFEEAHQLVESERVEGPAGSALRGGTLPTVARAADPVVTGGGTTRHSGGATRLN